MTSPIAIDDIEIQHSGNVVRLRPSLRSGILIASRYTLDELRDVLGTVDFGALSYIITLGADDREKAVDIIGRKLAEHGAYALSEFVPAIMAFVSASMGLTSGNEHDQAEPSLDEPDFTIILESLFEFATGWLGWTPAETWISTPAEIVAARKGHFEMLRAIHGSGDQDAPASPMDDLPTPEQVKLNIAGLRDKLRGFA